MGYPNDTVDIHKRTFDFGVKIVTFCRTLDNIPSNWVLSKQLTKAGTSVGANVEEAQGAQSKSDFISKMSIALKESRESNFWLRVIKESKASDSDSLPFLIKESNELMKILATIIRNSRQ